MTCDSFQSVKGIDPFFPNGDIVFQVVYQVYFFAIAFLFIMSLGNRPQGSKWLYYSLATLFALIMGLMLFMGGWTIYLAIKNYDEFRKRNNTSFIKYFSSTPTFRDMVVSVVSTYGLYLISSLIHLDFWHLLTSMIQYLFLLPTYINIFMIYSFCNLHDVSWGTK